jgi:hypothetical protein
MYRTITLLVPLALACSTPKYDYDEDSAGAVVNSDADDTTADTDEDDGDDDGSDDDGNADQDADADADADDARPIAVVAASSVFNSFMTFSSQSLIFVLAVFILDRSVHPSTLIAACTPPSV